MPFVGDRVLDLGLNVLDTEATHIELCSSEPTTYTQATSTNNLGNKNLTSGAVFGAPAAGSPNGRQVTSVAVTDGSVTASGTATHAAVTDRGNSRLLATASLSASQAVVNGNQFTLAAITVRLPNQA